MKISSGVVSIREQAAFVRVVRGIFIRRAPKKKGRERREQQNAHHFFKQSRQLAQWWKVAVTSSILLQWRHGVALWKAESKLYRCRHYLASLEHLLPMNSVKNGSTKRPAACKSRPTAGFSIKISNFDKITIWQPLESSFQDESIGTIIIIGINAARAGGTREEQKRPQNAAT